MVSEWSRGRSTHYTPRRQDEVPSAAACHATKCRLFYGMAPCGGCISQREKGGPSKGPIAEGEFNAGVPTLLVGKAYHAVFSRFARLAFCSCIVMLWWLI